VTADDEKRATDIFAAVVGRPRRAEVDRFFSQTGKIRKEADSHRLEGFGVRVDEFS